MIVYAVIARSIDGSILAEASILGLEGNHPQIMTELIATLRRNPLLVPSGNRKTFVYASFENNADKLIASKATTVDARSSNATGHFEGFWSNGLDALDNLIEQVVGKDEDDDDDDHEKQQIPEKASIEFNSSNGFFFHVLAGESVFYICLSDDSLGRQHQVNFSFLHEVQKQFTSEYTPNRIARALAYGMDQNFTPSITKLMHYYNTHRQNMMQDPKVTELKSQIESLKNTMGQNITLAIKREHQIERMLQTSDDIVERSMVFTKRTKVARRRMIRKKVICKIILVACCGLLLYCFFAMICGFTGQRCAIHRNQNVN